MSAVPAARLVRNVMDAFPQLTFGQALAAAERYERGEEFTFEEAVCAVTVGHDFVFLAGAHASDGARCRCRHCGKVAEA